MLTLDKVYKASHLLKSVARYTDMIESNGLTGDCQLRLKAENLHLQSSGITLSLRLSAHLLRLGNIRILAITPNNQRPSKSTLRSVFSAEGVSKVFRFIPTLS